jgi:tetratricopeptide (TPR) repeat protein
MNKKTKVILFIILGMALFIRLAHWWAVRDDPFIAQLVMDSEEYDRWAQEIARGDWIGSEVFFQAPLYPYFLAIVYFLFGHILNAVYLIQLVIALAGIYALFRAGRKLVDEKVGLFAAALSAFYGVYVFYDVQLLKESLAVTMVCFLIWILVEAREKKGFALWVCSGVLCGLLTLLRENMLLIVPFLLLLVIQPRERIYIFFLRALALILGVGIILTPVAFRNLKVGGNFLPSTFQGGVNFFIGNNPQATGTYQPLSPGKQVPSYERTEPIRLAEKEMGRPLEPFEVSNFWLHKSLRWAQEHPSDFLKLQFKKAGMFWSWYEWPDAVDYYYVKQTSFIYKLPLFEFGSISLLALIGLWFVRRRIRPFFPVLLFVLMWMASTIVFFLFSRYRLPVVPGLILIGATAVGVLLEGWKEKRRQSAIILALVVLGGIAPLFVRFKPKMDLVHYNLALVYEKMENINLAEQHYKEAYSINPNDFLSCINLGNLAMNEKKWDEALEWYEKAEAIESRAEGVHANIGAVYVALGQFDYAERAFARALEINPENVEALHNISILLAMKGQYEKALEVNRKVLRLVPDWPPALQFRTRLDQRLKKK